MLEKCHSNSMGSLNFNHGLLLDTKHQNILADNIKRNGHSPPFQAQRSPSIAIQPLNSPMRFSTFAFLVTVTTLVSASVLLDRRSCYPGVFFFLYMLYENVVLKGHTLAECAFKCPQIFVKGNTGVYHTYLCGNWECMCKSGDFISSGFICITNACREYPKDRQKALIQWKEMCRLSPYVIFSKVLCRFLIYI